MFQFWVDFIQKLTHKDDSAQVAAGRLKGSVFMDRLCLSPATLDQIRQDVVRSISRYLVIDENAMTLAVQAQGRTVALAASIPVVRPREAAASPGFTVHETYQIAPRTSPDRDPHPTQTSAVAVCPSDEVTERPDSSPGVLDPRTRARAVRRRRQGRRLGMQP